MLKSWVFLTTNQDLVKDKTITSNWNFPKTKTVPQSLLFPFLTFSTLKTRNSNYQRSLRNASETFMTYTGHWNMSTMTIAFSTRDTRSFYVWPINVSYYSHSHYEYNNCSCPLLRLSSLLIISSIDQLLSPYDAEMALTRSIPFSGKSSGAH